MPLSTIDNPVGPKIAPDARKPHHYFYTHAPISASGYFSHGIANRVNVQPIIHPFIGNGTTWSNTVRDQIAQNIHDTLQQLGFTQGNGTHNGGLSAGAVYIHNAFNGTVADLSIDGGPSDLPGSGAYHYGAEFSPSCNVSRDLAYTRFKAVAERVKTLCDASGTAYPAKLADDCEGVANRGVTFAPSIAMRHYNAGTPVAGWYDWLENQAEFSDPNYAGIVVPNGGAGVVRTWEQIESDITVPTRNDSLNWDHADNLSFTNWVASRMLEKNSSDLRFGPHRGFIETFPTIETSNYSMGWTSGYDPGAGQFGNDNYAAVRLTPRFLHQTQSAIVLDAPLWAGRRQGTETPNEFFVRFCKAQVDTILPDKRSTSCNWHIPPGVSKNIGGTMGLPAATLTPTVNDLFEICKHEYDAGITEFHWFVSGAPFPRWSLLEQVIEALDDYAAQQTTTDPVVPVASGPTPFEYAMRRMRAIAPKVIGQDATVYVKPRGEMDVPTGTRAGTRRAVQLKVTRSFQGTEIDVSLPRRFVEVVTGVLSLADLPDGVKIDENDAIVWAEEPGKERQITKVEPIVGGTMLRLHTRRAV